MIVAPVSGFLSKIGGVAAWAAVVAPAIGTKAPKIKAEESVVAIAALRLINSPLIAKMANGVRKSGQLSGQL